MTSVLYIATAIGLFIAAQTNGHWVMIRHTLKEKALTSIAASDGIILAGTADGIGRSSDNGQSWHASNRRLSIRHVRWIVASPGSPMTVLVGTEPAGIFVSNDGGQTWQPASDGLMPAPWPRHMVERFVQLDNDLVAILSNGEFWLKPPDGSPWRRFLPNIHQAKAVAVQTAG